MTPDAHRDQLTPCAACLFAGLACLVGLWPLEGWTEERAPTKRVLLIQQTGFGDPGNARFDAAFVETLRSAGSVPIQVSKETIETLRFPDTQHLFIDYVRGKYAAQKIDVIVTIGIPALTFARKNRDIFGNPPIVAAVSQAEQIDRSNNITGLQAGPAVWIDGMIQLAQALLPEACCLYVIDGIRGNTGEFQAEVERRWR